MSWPLEQLGPGAVMYAGMGIKDHTRTAIQLLSTGIEKSRVYTHTGWRKFSEGWFYLNGGGAIGEDGLYEVLVQLPPDLSAFDLPEPRKGDALKAAVRASLSIMDLGPRGVVMPSYCSLLRSVLGTANFSNHLAGPTQTFKTSVAALLQQHFGKGFDLRNVPASWSSTENALEAMQFIMKDALLLIDDFAPRGSRSDIERFHQKADRVFRGQGNNAGRSRMKADSSLRLTKKARGTTLSTGEDIPKGESLKARLLIIELQRNTIDPVRLTKCQEDASAGLYSAAMASFLSWLAPRYDSVLKKMPKRIAALREEASRSNQHRRTPEIVANLFYAMKVFLRFCWEMKVLSDEEIDDLRDETWEALGRAAAAQAQEQGADEPAQRFIDLLSAAWATGDAYLVDVRNGNNRQRPGRCIGWIDGEYILLEPEASYAEAQRMASQQGDALSVVKNTLWKRLREKGLLARREKGRNLVKWTIQGKERRVLCLFATALPITTSSPTTQ